MMLKKDYLHHGWLVGLILVLGTNYALYHTTVGARILPEETNAIVIGSMLDLVIVAPLLFIAWKRKWSWKNIFIATAAGLIVVRFLIPLEYLAPFEKVTWIGFVIEGLLVLLELVLIITLFKYMPSIVRSVKASSLPVVFSFSNAVEEKMKGHPIIRIVSSEMLIFYYAFASWRKRPKLSGNEFTLHHNSSFIALRVMLIHALVIETAAVHWMLYDKHFVLAMILLVADLYAVILFIGDLQAVRLNPLQVTDDRLYLSFGLMKRMEIKWTDIQEVVDDAKSLEQKRSKGILEFVARDFEETNPTVILILKQPVEAKLLMGFGKSYEKVAIRVDDSARFKTLLKEKLL